MSAVNFPYAEVIGDPIDQSKSPVIHRFWLQQSGISGDYRRHQVKRGELDAYLAARRADPNWRGCNVTMPLKLDAIAAADHASDLAVAAGAANILVPQAGQLIAANSDVGAVMLLLKRLFDAGRAMGEITLFGNGGAARAVLVACRGVGINNVRIQARDMSAAYKLAVEFGLQQEPLPFDQPVEGDGLINATPLGMVGNRCLNCDLERLSAKGWVFDLVTAPAETELVQRARERGLEVVTGIDMLVEQAAASFEMFYGAAPNRAHDDQLFAMLKA